MADPTHGRDGWSLKCLDPSNHLIFYDSVILCVLLGKCLSLVSQQQAGSSALCLRGLLPPRHCFSLRSCFTGWRDGKHPLQGSSSPVFGSLDICSCQTCPWWLGQPQEAGFHAEGGSAGALFTTGWSWGLFPGRDGAVRGLPQGTTLGCFFSLV